MISLKSFSKVVEHKTFLEPSERDGASSRKILAKIYPWSKKVLLRKTFGKSPNKYANKK